MRRFLYSLVVVTAVFGMVEGVARAYGARALLDRTGADGEGGLKIVCIGDSWTFGVSMERPDTYPALLQSYLRVREGVPSTVRNEGMPGAHAAKVNLSLYRYFQGGGEADVVLYLAGRNPVPDWVLTHDAQTDSYAADRSLLMRRLFRHSAVYGMLTQSINRARLAKDTLFDGAKRINEVGHHLASDDESRVNEIRTNLARASAITDAYGAELYALTYGIPVDTPVHVKSLNDVIRDGAAIKGVELLDVARGFQARELTGAEVWLYGEKQARLRDDFHLNARGYRYVADLIAEELGRRY